MILFIFILTWVDSGSGLLACANSMFEAGSENGGNWALKCCQYGAVSGSCQPTGPNDFTVLCWRSGR